MNNESAKERIMMLANQVIETLNSDQYNAFLAFHPEWEEPVARSIDEWTTMLKYDYNLQDPSWPENWPLDPNDLCRTNY